MAANDVQVPIATQYQILNDRRVIVFTGRDQFALNDTALAVPFGLLKFLSGSLVTAEGQAELQRLGVTLNESPPQKVM